MTHMQYAQVAIDAAIDMTFTYHIPPELDGQLTSGHLVRVSFRTAMEPGIVVALQETSPVEVTKPILERLDPEPVVTPQQIALAQWMSARFLAPIGQCLWLMLPPGMVGDRDIRVTLAAENPAPLDGLQAQIVDLLARRGPLRGGQIALAVKNKKWEAAVRALAIARIVTVEPILAPPRVRPQVIKVAALAIHPDRLPDILPHLPDKTRDRSEAILRVLARETKPINVSWVYAQTETKLADLKRLAEMGLVWLGEKASARDSLAALDFVSIAPPKLTEGQARVWAEIREVIRIGDGAARVPSPVTPDQREGLTAEAGRGPGPKPFLLHGVTGSGKTEIYLRAIEATLDQGRQAIFCVPEIALTAQTVRRVAARFPGRVAVVHDPLSDDAPSAGQIALLHSRLSQGERYDTWRRARAGEIDIVVGTRSALFTPLPDLGLIILDEEHDHSYKQSPPVNAPYYHAREVAERLMRDNHGVLILGSATPDVETYHRAQRGDFTLLHLPDRIMGHRARIAEQADATGVIPGYHPADDADDALAIELPPVTVIDMRAELKAGNTRIFSRALRSALAETLRRGEQAILFLNRRGTASYVFCRDCGYVATCPRCDMPLTYHDQGADLRCHHCGYVGGAPDSCPQCRSSRIRYFGAGTQQIEAAFKAEFPDVLSVRWDADTAARAGDHDLILQRFAAREARVLIGTQMIAKGLDLPLVTLVGVISADVGLALPDFRACERTFSMLTQVAARAGRGLLGGQAIFQTYQPDHYAIRAAAQQDYAAFYAREIEARRELGYPPFRRMARVLIQHDNPTQAMREAVRVARLLEEAMTAHNLTGTTLIGPAPCFFGRINRAYRWQIILRGPDPLPALRDLDLGRFAQIDPDPLDVL